MNKGTLVENVYIRVNGGKPSTDSKILRVDIRALVTPAVNFAMVQLYYDQIKQEGDRDLPGTFFAYYSAIQIQRDLQRMNRPYITLPINVVAMAGGRGIRHIVDNCDNTYKPISNGQLGSIGYWSDILSHERFFRSEGKKVYLINVPPVAKEMNAVLVINSDTLTDEDELPIPAGMEMQVMETLVGWVTGTKEIPADYKIDNKDLN